MVLDEFKDYVAKLRVARPEYFFTEFWDKVASPINIEGASNSLSCHFPVEYLEYVREYGGGDALGVRIYSCDKDSDLHIVKKNANLRGWLPKGLVAFSDNGCGDYYVFRSTKGVCASEVYLYRHEEKSLSGAQAADLFEFITRSTGD